MKRILQLVLLSTLIIDESKADSIFQNAQNLYSQGKYQATVQELTKIEEKVKTDVKSLGLVHYWKGMAYNRLQEYPSSETEFKMALSHNYNPQDLHYELGQSLFASEKLIDARIQFSESFKRAFKISASLYYMAYISKELGETENAKTLYESIMKLPDSESQEAKQAASFQLADIKFLESEKKPDVFRAMKTEVLPAYENAIAVNPDSALVPKIQEKIKEIQKKYELVLFQLANGRQALVPPYFLRVAQEIGVDTNVTFSPTETTIAKSKQSSFFSKSEVMGRYTFYHKNYFSYSPELRFTNTYYFNRVPEIYKNDNYFMVPAIRTSYEHTFLGAPASFLVDYEYNEAQRDVNAKERLEFSSRAHVFMIGERFKFTSLGETVLRLRQRSFESYIEASSSKTTSLVFEQVLGFSKNTFLFYGSLDRVRVNSDVLDTNAMTLRADWLLPKFNDWFNPSLGMGLTVTDPINDRSDRGLETLVNPFLRLSRSFGKNWRLNSRFEYQRNNSKDKKNFAFTKNIAGMELEYIF
jgi:tetratricopeptide (TPR) repeat protein